MSQVRTIRAKLRKTQCEIAAAIRVTQGSVSAYENGRPIPPPVAARLIEYAASNGLSLTFDDIYSAGTRAEEGGDDVR